MSSHLTRKWFSGSPVPLKPNILDFVFFKGTILDCVSVSSLRSYSVAPVLGLRQHSMHRSALLASLRCSSVTCYDYGLYLYLWFFFTLFIFLRYPLYIYSYLYLSIFLSLLNLFIESTFIINIYRKYLYNTRSSLRSSLYPLS